MEKRAGGEAILRGEEFGGSKKEKKAWRGKREGKGRLREKKIWKWEREMRKRKLSYGDGD